VLVFVFFACFVLFYYYVWLIDFVVFVFCCVLFVIVLFVLCCFSSVLFVSLVVGVCGGRGSIVSFFFVV